jgi:hypothetical protein
MPLAHRLQPALQLLLEAHEYAREVACDSWQFAVEIDALYAAGLTNSDLRWLLHAAYAEQARELTAEDDPARTFGPDGGRRLGEASCFVLTPAGVLLAAGLGGTSEPPSRPAAVPIEPTPPPVVRPAAPAWDRDRRCLWFGAELVKQFKVPAPNQEVILATFEEEGWPVRIDDPLPMHAAIDPKRRLHDTINSLNRNQRVRCLRFVGNGCGEAIRWEPLAGPAPDEDAA